MSLMISNDQRSAIKRSTAGANRSVSIAALSPVLRAPRKQNWRPRSGALPSLKLNSRCLGVPWRS